MTFGSRSVHKIHLNTLNETLLHLNKQNIVELEYGLLLDNLHELHKYI